MPFKAIHYRDPRIQPRRISVMMSYTMKSNDNIMWKRWGRLKLSWNRCAIWNHSLLWICMQYSKFGMILLFLYLKHKVACLSQNLAHIPSKVMKHLKTVPFSPYPVISWSWTRISDYQFEKNIYHICSIHIHVLISQHSILLLFPPFFERKKPKEPWQNMFDPKFQWKGPPHLRSCPWEVGGLVNLWEENHAGSGHLFPHPFRYWVI